jgi:hypothetical protein
MWSGYGWFITKDNNRRLVFYDDGADSHIPGYQLYYGRYLDDEVTIIELSNLATPTNDKDIGAALAAMVFARR